MQTHSSVLGTHLLLKQYGSFSVSSYLWKFTHSQHLPFLLQVFDGQLHNEEYKLISHTILSPSAAAFFDYIYAVILLFSGEESFQILRHNVFFIVNSGFR